MVGRLLGVLLAGALLAGCSGSGDGGTEPPPVSPPDRTDATSPGGAGEVTSLVYYLVDTRTGFRLARERRRLDADDPATSALEAMIAGSDDPDYTTTWAPDTRVLSVERSDGAIVVDLSAQARTANAGSEVAARMVQQLVYTVTEVMDEAAPVRLLIEGEPAGDLWGVLTWNEPIVRDGPVDVRVLVQIDNLAEGEQVTSPVQVAGTAAVFEATLPWRVLDRTGAQVAAGTAMTDAGQRFAPYSFSVELDPGTYVVEVREDDPSGGEGGEPMTDTRTIVVE